MHLIRKYGANIGHRKRVLYIKQYKYADKDIKKLIGSIVVLVDTREKQNRHITDYFYKNNIAYEPTTLSYGDYSFYIPADVAGENIYCHREESKP